MSGRSGSSGHQNLIRMASQKLLKELIGDKWLNITVVREMPLDVKTQSEIRGLGFGYSRVAFAEVRMYADIACIAQFDAKADRYKQKEPLDSLDSDLMKNAERHKKLGNMDAYAELVKMAYGQMMYIIECEINPRSNLLRDGPKLTGYKLIKQQNNNLTLILAVFEGTKVDNPDIFDFVWEFPRKSKKTKEVINS